MRDTNQERKDKLGQMKMKPKTKEEAIAMFDGGQWEKMSMEDRFLFQIQEHRLCMPWDKFQEATEKALGRPVWSHEFAHPELLIDEYLEIKPKATLVDVIEQIPKDKRFVVCR